MSSRIPRSLALAVLVLLLAGAATAVAPARAALSGAERAGTQQIRTLAALDRGILAELNAVRRTHGLQLLRHSGPLAAAATTHSTAMARHGFFRHESRDGTSFAKRVQRFYSPAGYGSWSVGENLVFSSRLDAAGAVRMWMQSPPHRRNILRPGWREIGISAVTATNAPGDFGGFDVTIVTADFGART